MFPEALWNAWEEDGLSPDGIDFGAYPFNPPIFAPKYHTIRAGERWKAGDVFVPKIWSGKPYRSKTITIGPPIVVKQTWKIKIINKSFYWHSGAIGTSDLEKLAVYDALGWDDFMAWFLASKKDFFGQVICWSDEVKYPLQ